MLLYLELLLKLRYLALEVGNRCLLRLKRGLELAHLVGVLVDHLILASHSLHDLCQLRLARLHLVTAVRLERHYKLVGFFELRVEALVQSVRLVQLLSQLG